MNIVIADDAGYIIELLKDIFVNSGHKVNAIATNGKEAIELTYKLKPDVLFLDLVMPDYNGLEAAKEIIHSNPNQNIVICSSLTEKWIHDKAIEVGCKYFLAKPFTKEQVLESLQFIDNKQKERKHG